MVDTPRAQDSAVCLWPSLPDPLLALAGLLHARRVQQDAHRDPRRPGSLQLEACHSLWRGACKNVDRRPAPSYTRTAFSSLIVPGADAHGGCEPPLPCGGGHGRSPPMLHAGPSCPIPPLALLNLSRPIAFLTRP